MTDGKVCVRVQGDDLLIRCRTEKTDELLSKPGAHRYTMKGKPNMKGWLLIDSKGCEDQESFDFWIETALDFFRSR